MKTCKICGVKFEPTYTSFQKTCSDLQCIIQFGRKEAERLQKAKQKQEKKQHRESDKGYWVKRLQTTFNKWIRHRDSGQPCISCAKVMTGQIHAGHYKTVGGHPELRFEPDNCHAQCAQCNNWKSGNLSEYRANLIKKIGLERVEWLEGPHDKRNYTIPELKDLLELYKGLLNGNDNPS